jgi:hypothetical protein
MILASDADEVSSEPRIHKCGRWSIPLAYIESIWPYIIQALCTDLFMSTANIVSLPHSELLRFVTPPEIAPELGSPPDILIETECKVFSSCNIMLHQIIISRLTVQSKCGV